MTASNTGERPRLSGTNLERAADHNQRVTLHAIRVLGPLTRVELAGITGLTGPAIANITKRLLQDGLIDEAGQRRGGRGQPPTKLVVRADACYSIGVNIDRDHITLVLVDFSGETLARVSEEVDFALPDHVRALYRRSVKNMLRKAGVDVAKVVGLGVAVPDDLGLVDLPGRPADYAAWDKVNMAELFREPLDLPVFVENDAAAAAMGEMQLGLGQKNNSFFYVLISSGLGGGLVVDGSYLRGADGRSGELGFMRAGDGAAPGEEVQRLVSLSGLARHLERNGCKLADVMHGPDPDDATIACVSAWIEDAARQLIVPLDAINCLINPAAVLVGGRLPTAILERLAARANELMKERAGLLPTVAPVARAALSEDAPAVGAAILPFSHFLLPKQAALWKASA
ncbi:putative NBD/HSP70 family sugar kinase [Sphingomonas naasensis]|uniref:ROK family transcriptional regulator n=1 Tax=Sphingomonas naasensis TaxID=1344951 RepID=A0A4S1WUI1_9SPHN|nr:ROK family transcriptional regulator [Sphingomonas naasensis]NIJ18624.1 putative NBD/HSP70 family sugar kinase [Sphingomonas naasensis]TGX45870.1 ROK family transcriptional regulator [Sphingomonas naasensis]